jgi:hypothetical protein
MNKRFVEGRVVEKLGDLAWVMEHDSNCFIWGCLYDWKEVATIEFGHIMRAINKGDVRLAVEVEPESPKQKRKQKQ